MPVKRQFSSADFLRWLRDYLPVDASVHECNGSGHPGKQARLEEWRENRFYSFDSDAVAGISHAIEVLALEEANGELTSLMGDFREFESHRECYLQLAATIDRVEALGFGRAPRNLRHLQFRRDERARHYRGVLFQGAEQQALFICRVRSGEFPGFFTLDRRLVTRFSDELRAEGGRQLREFSRLEALDHAAKELEKDLARQRETLDTAVRRLQTDKRYQPGHFASDLEKGLSRLSEWKSKMPEILARLAR